MLLRNAMASGFSVLLVMHACVRGVDQPNMGRAVLRRSTSMYCADLMLSIVCRTMSLGRTTTA